MSGGVGDKGPGDDVFASKFKLPDQGMGDDVFASKFRLPEVAKSDTAAADQKVKRTSQTLSQPAATPRKEGMPTQSISGEHSS